MSQLTAKFAITRSHEIEVFNCHHYFSCSISSVLSRTHIRYRGSSYRRPAAIQRTGVPPDKALFRQR